MPEVEPLRQAEQMSSLLAAIIRDQSDKLRSEISQIAESCPGMEDKNIDQVFVLMTFRVLLNVYYTYFPELIDKEIHLDKIDYLNPKSWTRYLLSTVLPGRYNDDRGILTPFMIPEPREVADRLFLQLECLIKESETLLAKKMLEAMRTHRGWESHHTLALFRKVMTSSFSTELLQGVASEFGFNITFKFHGPGGAIEEGFPYFATQDLIKLHDPDVKYTGVMLPSQCATAYLRKILAGLEFIVGNELTTFQGHVLSRHRFTDPEGNTGDVHYLGMLHGIAKICSAGPNSVRMAVINSASLTNMLGLPGDAEHSANYVHSDVIWELLRACLPELPPYFSEENPLLGSNGSSFSVEPQPSQFSEKGSPIKYGKPGIELITQFPLEEERYFHLIYSAVAVGYLPMVIVNWEQLNPRLFSLYQDPRHILLITGFDANGTVTYIDSALPSESMTQRVSFSHLFQCLYQGQVSFLNVSLPSSKTPSITELSDGFQGGDLIPTRDIKGDCAEALLQKFQDQHQLAMASQETQSHLSKLAFIAAISDHLNEITEAIVAHLPKYIHADALSSFPGNWVMAFQMAYFLLHQPDILKASSYDFLQNMTSLLAELDEIPLRSSDFWQVLIKPLIESPEGIKLIAQYLLDRPPYSMPRRYEMIKEIISQLPGDRKTIFDMGAGLGAQWSGVEAKNFLFRNSCDVIQLDTLGSDQEGWLMSFAAIYPGDLYSQRGELYRHIQEDDDPVRVTKIRQMMSLPPISTRVSDEQRLKIARTTDTVVAILSFSLHQNRTQAENILTHAASYMTQSFSHGFIITIGEPHDFDNQETQPGWPIRVYQIKRDGSRELIDDTRVLGADQMTPLKSD